MYFRPGDVEQAVLRFIATTFEVEDTFIGKIRRTICPVLYFVIRWNLDVRKLDVADHCQPNQNLPRTQVPSVSYERVTMPGNNVQILAYAAGL